jgi:hypothetical protein
MEQVYYFEVTPTQPAEAIAKSILCSW